MKTWAFSQSSKISLRCARILVKIHKSTMKFIFTVHKWMWGLHMVIFSFNKFTLRKLEFYLNFLNLRISWKNKNSWLSDGFSLQLLYPTFSKFITRFMYEYYFFFEMRYIYNVIRILVYKFYDQSKWIFFSFFCQKTWLVRKLMKTVFGIHFRIWYTAYYLSLK